MLYIFVWTLAPTFINTSVALDVSEGINWGNEWQWGYYKHPPFSSWVLYSFYALFGHGGVYILSQICVLITLVCNYQLGKRVWSIEVGVLGAVLTMGVFYYTYPTLEFNHNIAQFPIWSGLALVFYLAVTESKWSHWIWLGILGGIGMLTKYSVVFLLLPLALYLLLPRQLPILKTVKPWVSVMIMLVIFAPHFYWLANHDWLTLSYAQGRGYTNSFFKAHFNWLGFLGAQIVVHVPLIIIAFLQRKSISGVKEYREKIKPQSSVKLMWFMWFSPVVLVVLLSLVFGVKLKDMWGMPMWGLSGLLVASLIKTDALHSVIPKALKGIAIWLSIITTLMVIYISFGHSMRKKPTRMDWNEKALTQHALTTWEKNSVCALDNVSGDRWLTALVAMNTDGFPSQIFNGSPNKTPWMNKSRLAEYGTLLMWQNKKNKKPPVIELLKGSEKIFTTYSGQWTIPWPKNTKAAPLLVQWTAYIPYSCVKK
ncbi:MAG: glycosyltransferase family 39 protein [Gammaproteobacteria bacterium]|nr:glycosyltransferase family 39 protein [Gammaproteobacteria bacterium]